VVSDGTNTFSVAHRRTAKLLNNERHNDKTT
jgi:hypothetical protein